MKVVIQFLSVLVILGAYASWFVSVAVSAEVEQQKAALALEEQRRSFEDELIRQNCMNQARTFTGAVGKIEKMLNALDTKFDTYLLARD